MSFSQLGLDPSLSAPLAGLGYTTPTPVQSASIPLVLDGGDVLARAQTGTGKTAAFGLPMIQRLMAARRRGGSRGPLGLVLVPTRELALQVHKSLATYGAPLRLRVTHIFGGVAMGPQIKALRQGTDIIVATPGRLIDHLDRRTADLSRIEIVTLDEADRMLDMGFMPALRRLLPALPESRQTLLYSATFAEEVVRLSSQFTRNPRRVDISDGDVVAPTITHRVHRVAQERKTALLVHVLNEKPAAQALVFCKTKRGADRVGDHLSRAGLAAAVIHGNKGQGARTRSLADFKSGRVGVLVATDIAARGLDIAQLPLVVNYDLPLVAADYVHRVGRTGRAGLAGHAVSLVSQLDHHLLRDIQKLLPAPIEEVAVQGFEGASASFTPAPRPSAPRGRGHNPRHRYQPGSSHRPGAGRRDRGRSSSADRARF